jgi:hypothetical protein
MAERMDIVCPRAGGDGKTYYTKIGVAFATRNGGWSLTFEALPLPSIGDNGKLETRALLMPPRERDAPQQTRQAPQGGSRTRAPASDDLDDDVPFVYNGLRAGDVSGAW